MTRNHESCFYIAMQGIKGLPPLSPAPQIPADPSLRCASENSAHNVKLDDSDHFSDNQLASVAALRSLIGFPRNTDRLRSGTLIAITGIRTLPVNL
jgi:hypothetical protein